MSGEASPNQQAARAHLERAIAMRTAGQVPAALDAFNAAIAADPTAAHAFIERGTAHWMLGRPQMALEDYERAAGLAPSLPEAHFNRAAALQAIKRLPEALASVDQGLALAPNHPGAHTNRGAILIELGALEAALASLERAVALAPGNASALNNRAAVLFLLGRYEAAQASAEAALAVQPNHPDALFHLGNIFKSSGRPEEAAASYGRAFAAKPQKPYLRGMVLNARMQICEWQGFDADIAALRAALDRGEAAIAPFALLALIDAPAVQRRVAERWTADKAGTAPLKLAAHPKRDRLRVAYFSGDFRQHPVATLMAGVFEHHDHARFETFAFSFGPNTGDDMHRRLMRAFDHFIDARAIDDPAVVTQARELGIDVAVDLAGHTAEARHGIFAGRAAPVQISYLGYPGTLGSPHTDYVIADRVVIPAKARGDYTEKVIELPCFQPNDPARAIAAETPTRAAAGLPDEAFVYCCFNNAYKFNPATFAGWMRILRAVEGSVLWFSGITEAGQRNLRAAAANAGLAPARLIFAARVPTAADHLARHRCADLFLDTLPFNAHTTASDALWAGLPVLTCPGESYAARVAASLLTALDLPELIAPNAGAYEEVAVTLGRDPARLAALRTKLARARATSPLFDVKSVTKALERAYRAVDERHRQGLAPADLVIDL